MAGRTKGFAIVEKMSGAPGYCKDNRVHRFILFMFLLLFYNEDHLGKGD